jgi:hypothetical protein
VPAARWSAPAGGAVVLAALSLALPWALAFDPMAWVLWGREITRGTLYTSAGPSWKPLPVLFTTPFALAGGAAPALWLVIGRAGALLALAGAARLAALLVPPQRAPAAALAAAGVLALSPWWLFNGALGNSEGMLAAAVLWAAVAHLRGRPGAAFGLGLAASLLRPEAWPFLGLYAVWLWAGRRVPRAVIAAGLAVLPVAWIVPGLLGGGGALSASDAARGTPSQGSAALADVPALAVLGDAVELLTWPVAVALVPAVVLLRGSTRVLAAMLLAWVLIVAAMSQAGYAGNPRYLVAAAAVACALAPAGAVRAAGWPGAVVLVAAVAVVTAGDLADQVDELGVRARARTGLPRAIERAGGAVALERCAAARTSAAARTYVAWELDLPLPGLADRPRPPVVLFRARPPRGGPAAPPLPRGAGLREAARAPDWQIWTACRA